MYEQHFRLSSLVLLCDQLRVTGHKVALQLRYMIVQLNFGTEANSIDRECLSTFCSVS